MKIIIDIKNPENKMRLKEFINAIRDLRHIMFSDVVNSISLDEMHILDLEFDENLSNLKYNYPDGFNEDVIGVIEGFVNFGNVARSRMGKQCQYGSRYVDGVIHGYLNLGKGLRFSGNTDMYHSLKIHKNDVNEFIKRYDEYIESRM